MTHPGLAKVMSEEEMILKEDIKEDIAAALAALEDWSAWRYGKDGYAPVREWLFRALLHAQEAATVRRMAHVLNSLDQ